MNKIYNIVWNSSTSQWTVASELAKAQGAAHSQSVSKQSNPITLNQTNTTHKLNRLAASVGLAVIATLGSSFIVTQAMAAECPGSLNLVVDASGGVACDVSGTVYSYISASNAGTVANVANDVTVYGSGGFTAGVVAASGAVINFAGDANITAAGNRHGLYVGGGSTVNVGGDLTAQAGSGGVTRAVFVDGGSTLNVAGNLVATNGLGGSRGSAVVQNNPGTVLNVAGTTDITTTISDYWVAGMRLMGTATFGGTVTVNVNNPGREGLLLGGNNQFNQDVVINNSGAYAISGGGINQVGGSSKIAGNLTIGTIGSASHGVNISAGTLSVLGRSEIGTVGAGAHGVVASVSGSVALGGLATAGTSPNSVSVTVESGSSIKTQGKDASGIVASAAGGATIKTAGSISSAGGDGINVVKVVGGSTITNSGDITAAATGKFVIAGGDAVETVTTTAGKLTGNTDLGAGNDRFTASGGALIGNTLMGNGDDVATLTGTVDVTQAPQFDGGVGTDVLNVDGLALRGFTAASNDGTGNLTETNNSNLTGWETINVKNAGTLKLSNNLFTAANTGTLNVDATSTLDLKGNSPAVFTVYGDVNNSGMMTMANGAADNVTTITGNYTGVAGSRFAIDTALGNDSSLTDKLVVNGNTSGATALSVTNVGGAGSPTVEGIQVVQVGGASDGTFSLAAPVQAGSYEYTLQKNGVSTPTDGDWYLRSTFVATCANTPSLCPIDPIDPIDPPQPPVHIYRPAVALYVTAQSANADAGLLQMSTLHQRMGEQRDLPTDKSQTWGRLIGAGVSNSGKSRFEYDQFTTGFQFGHDLLHKTSTTGTQQRAGVTVQYAHSSMEAKDRVRHLVGLGEDTGSMNSNSVGLGGYYTRMNQAGAYLDVVSQVNHLTNKFSDSYGGKSKQKGWQFGLSAEVGKPVADLGGWKFEPQAQLSYLHTRYDDFTDRYSNIDGLNASQLRGRLGLRVYKDFKVDNKAVQYYGIVNVHHDFLKAKSITLHDRVGTGSVSMRESYDQTFGEVGLGIQGHIRNNTYVYADARYQQSFKGNKEGAQFNVGIKASF